MAGGGGPRILLAVTADQSLKLMRGFPRYLVEAGWDVNIVSGGDSKVSASVYAGECSSVTFHRVPMVRDPSPLRDILGLIYWIRLLHEVRPDMVSVGTPKASLLGLLAAKLLGVPVRVHILRGLRCETATGYWRMVLVWFERLTAWTATQTIAVSPSLRTLALQLGIGDSQRIAVLGSGSSNGVEVREVADFEGRPPDHRSRRKAELGLDPNLPTVGFVGRLTPDKGLGDLASALISLRELGVETQLVLVGEEDLAGYVDTLLEPLSRHGITVHQTGYVADPSRFFAAMDIFCLPSLREGLPNVSLEAAVHYLPVITTDATGCIDSVIHEVTGLIYPKGDVKALARSLRVLATDDAKRNDMGEAGARWVSNTFNRVGVWTLHEKFYRELVSHVQ